MSEIKVKTFLTEPCPHCRQPYEREIFDQDFQIGDIVATDRLPQHKYRVDSIQGNGVFHGTCLTPEVIAWSDGPFTNCRIDTRDGQYHKTTI